MDFRTDFTVDLVDSMGDDDSVLKAMLVSTSKDQGDLGTETSKKGRLGFLMRGRHGTPFEHNSMTFRVEAPIFVFREWHRHRIGISINEQSGRYTEFLPVFYVPPRERALVQVGKPGSYTYVAGTDEQYNWLVSDMEKQAESQWASYQERLSRDIALEVARMSLGVNIYSSMYWTCNARSLMAFLSLRTREEAFWQEESHLAGEVFSKNPGGAMFPSGPMWEIEACARALEQVFEALFPITYELWASNGRVAP